MNTLYSGLGRGLCLGLMIGWSALADSALAAPPEKKKSAPQTHTVGRGALKGKVQLDAVFEAVETAPLKLEPKAWSDFTVLEAVPHGARVKKGDTLVKLDTDKIREQIAELEQDAPAAVVALEVAQAELANLQNTTPLKLEAARRSKQRTDDDFAYFESISRAQREKGSRFSVKSAEQRLENANEELAQLQKMYQADDLTEETEEIILKRQKYAVEAAEFSLESARITSERELKTNIPREHETLKAAKQDQEHASALSEETLPRALTKKRSEVEKLKRDQKKSERKLADLKKDLEAMNIVAPIDGVVYYGACENGKWSTGASVAKKLAPGGKLSGNEVFMTIVNPDKMLLKAVVPEAELGKLKSGQKAQASPVSNPDEKLAAKLEELGSIPLPGGGFEAKLSYKTERGVHLVPGMACKVSFNTGEKTEALTAPKEAVFSEGDQKNVYLVKPDGTSEKRTVKTGESDDKQIQILEGLSEGDKILLKKPE